MEPPIEQDIMQFFADYKPMSVIVPDDDEEKKKLKTTGVDGFITGNMSALIRKNENVINRDSLILDLDDVIFSESELIEEINRKFKLFDYILYPSMSHKEQNVRYRLVLPLDRPVKETEYKLLIHFFLNKVLSEVIKEADQSNFTWSQLQLLPVLTQHIKLEQIIISNGEKRFPVDDGIKTATNWLNASKKQSSHKYKNVQKYKKGGSRYRTTTTDLFESLVSDVGIGNRNNRIAQLTGGLLARAVDVSAVLELVQVANQHFTEPLPPKEVEETFYSIAKKELGAS